MDDVALVEAMRRRDPAGLDGAYRRYADRLYAYACSMVGDPHSAADVVHDTFLLASQHIGQLRDPVRLPRWLYTITRRESLRQLRHQARHAPLAAVGDPVAEPVGELAEGIAAGHAAEVTELVRSAISGLSTADREVAELAIRHQMAASEIAEVLDVSLRHAHARLSRVREQVGVALGALVVARHGRGKCRELAGLLRGWDGQLNPLLRKRLNRHIESCATCGALRKDRFSPAALLAAYAAAPFPVLPARTGSAPPGLIDSASPGRIDHERPAGVGTEHARVAPQAALARSGHRPPVAARTAGVAALLLVVVLGLAGYAMATRRGPSNPGLVEPSKTATPVATASSALTKPPAPLAFTTTATASCAGAPNVVLNVTATANTNLSSATLTVVGPIGTRTMSVNGRVAKVSVTGAASTEVRWRVRVRAVDGRVLAGPERVTANPCFG